MQNFVDVLANATPTTPNSGETRLFADSSSKTLNSVSDDGTVTSYASQSDVLSAVSVLSVNAQSDSYSIVLSDAGKLVTVSKWTAVTLTVPKNADVAFEIGTVVRVAQEGAGKLTVAGDTGVTVNSLGGNLSLAGQYSDATLIKTAADVWSLYGNLIA